MSPSAESFALELDGVTKTFGGLVAVSDVSLRVRTHARHALIGPNGAGKTTLFRLISGEQSLTRGRVRLFGADVCSLPPHARVARGLGRTYQITNVFPALTVADNVMLEVHDLHTYYALAHVLRGVSLDAPSGEVVALLGRNGAGKSTLVSSLMGLPPAQVRRGNIRYDGLELIGRAPHQIARLGIGLVPQGRRIYRSLSVLEHLKIAARPAPDGSRSWDTERIFALFPRLAERKHLLGSALSGGEQQMLAIARALVANPRLLLMDEPSEGLAPIIIQQLGERLLELKRSGLSILLVEQNLGLALRLADRVHILDRGAIVYTSTPSILAGDSIAKQRYLGVG